MAVQDADRPRDSYVFIRGEARNRGDRAPRQFLEILSGDDRKPFEDGSGRLDLARSISSKDNPLTARVFVNRVWQWHFGQALVKTPGDFGLRAEPPTHPKLLDWLSASFMEGGWSIKKLHRLILNSATWQQDSLRNEKYDEIDPGNDLLSRQNIQRLDFESMRDTLVVMGGKADLTVGGRSLDLDDEGEHRRTLYGYIDRANLDELFRVFDFANPDMSQAQRYNTTVPQQALFLMNSPQAIEEIRNLVNRPEMLSNATPEEKVTHLFKTTYQRIPSDEEMRLTLNFIAGKRQDKLDTPPHFAWEFGYGKYDSEGGRVLDFRPFPESSSRSSMFLPDRKVSREDVREKKARPYEVSMTGTGGAFANDTRRTLIRRWTAPVSGEIDISGELNGRSGGAEVMIAAVVSSKHGKLAEWKLTGKDQEATVKKFHVEENETIDFVVMPLKKLPIAYFNWAPTISMGEKNWKTARDFNTAARQERTGSTPLNAWERLAQVMIFGNELMYIN